MQLIFDHKKHETGDIWSFIFTAPDFTWTAGQSIRLEIEGPYGPIEHRFSISSAPSSNKIAITTRLSDSDYKESLIALKPGDEVAAYGLEGEFTWRESVLPHIFVAAGIGITPYVSMLAERVQQSYPLTVALLYGSRDNPPVFKDHFDAWAQKYPDFTVRYIPGRVSTADIMAQKNVHHRLIYISGPSKMASTLRAGLIAAGIDPAKILDDQFTGRLPADG